MSISPLQFLRQVKQEAKKVTWPTKKEVIPSCQMVIVLVVIAAVFFFVVDMILGWGVDKILHLG
ncbi:MAG: preprotein translocase subunit SecE [Alphaproteobacteria bacterium]|nr:preprotein translocase subunit SecE [Alphaproteobacteria bacterium]